MRGGQLLQDQPSEQAREHAYGEEEAGPAGDPALTIERDAAARHDHVDVRMVGECRAPGVENREDADAGAEVLGIGRDGDQGLGGSLEQDVVDHRLVVVGDVGDLGRQRKHDVEVRYRQQLGLTCGEPLPRSGSLAFGAMAVTTGVIGDLYMAALVVLAARDVPAERCRAAVLDRRHHLELAEADMAGVGLAPRLAMAAEDIRNLQLWTCQERRALGGRLSLDLVVRLLLGRVFDLVLLGLQRREAVERAHDLADRVGGNPRIERRRLKFGVTEQDLDHPNINVLFKQMGRKAVPQGVRRHALLEVGHLGGGMAGARELTCRYRVGWVLARKQPSLRPRDTIPVAQKFKQRRGKHRVAILATPRLRWGRLLPCSMRSIMRLESISQTFSAATSETRSPAP